MKVLIGYDGSECSDMALDGLMRAGLPEGTQVQVLTVADVWPGSLDSGVETLDETELRRLHGISEAEAEKLPAVVRRAYEHAHRELIHARDMAARGAERLRAAAPGWTVEAEAVADPPAWGIIRRAESWKADLVVVGSHGRSALGRLFLGSVSHFVLTHLNSTSVRISRCGAPTPEGPPRLVIGVDGSADSNYAVEQITKRHWPEGTQIRVVAALDPRLLTMPLMAGYPSWGYAGEFEMDERRFYEKMVGEAAEKLSSAGLKASPAMREGDPKWVLTDEAEQWGADCIFLGAQGHGALDRLLLGSVSMAVASRAKCAVEIVRPKREDQSG